MGIPLRQAITIGAYVLGQHLRGRQALSARAHARAAVPLQSRLRRLRQDRLPRQDSRSAPVGRRLPCMRSTNAARRSSCSPAASRCCTRSFPRSCTGRSPKANSSPSAPTRCCWRKSSTSTSRILASTGRSISTATRRCTTARSAGRESTTAPSRPCKPPRRRASASTSIARLFNDAEPERVADFFDTVRELEVDGITISPGYAYERAPDQQHFLNRAKTKQLFRDIFRRARGRTQMAALPVGPVPRFPRRQSDLSLHALGQSDPHRVRLAAALLSARRRLCQDLQGADGGHRLGRLRHRQLREMRRLHGALRLRGYGRDGCGEAAVEGRAGRAQGHQRPKGRWRPTSRSMVSGPRNTCSRATSSRS